MSVADSKQKHVQPKRLLCRCNMEVKHPENSRAMREAKDLLKLAKVGERVPKPNYGHYFE